MLKEIGFEPNNKRKAIVTYIKFYAHNLLSQNYLKNNYFLRGRVNMCQNI